MPRHQQHWVRRQWHVTVACLANARKPAHAHTRSCLDCPRHPPDTHPRVHRCGSRRRGCPGPPALSCFAFRSRSLTACSRAAVAVRPRPPPGPRRPRSSCSTMLLPGRRVSAGRPCAACGVVAASLPSRSRVEVWTPAGPLCPPVRSSKSARSLAGPVQSHRRLPPGSLFSCSVTAWRPGLKASLPSRWLRELYGPFLFFCWQLANLKLCLFSVRLGQFGTCM